VFYTFYNESTILALKVMHYTIENKLFLSEMDKPEISSDNQER
jgi:hypothetical protein